MKPTQTIEKFYTICPDNIPVTVQVVFTILYDPCYGADADGNRGIGEWSIDDVEIVTDDDELALSDDGNIILTPKQIAMVPDLIDKELAKEDLAELFESSCGDGET